MIWFVQFCFLIPIMNIVNICTLSLAPFFLVLMAVIRQLYISSDEKFYPCFNLSYAISRGTKRHK